MVNQAERYCSKGHMLHSYFRANTRYRSPGGYSSPCNYRTAQSSRIGRALRSSIFLVTAVKGLENRYWQEIRGRDKQGVRWSFTAWFFQTLIFCLGAAFLFLLGLVGVLMPLLFGSLLLPVSFSLSG